MAGKNSHVATSVRVNGRIVAKVLLFNAPAIVAAIAVHDYSRKERFYMKSFISGLLGFVFFIALAFGAFIFWDVSANGADITNSIFLGSGEKIEEPKDEIKEPEDDYGFLTSAFNFTFATDSVFNGVDAKRVENEKTAKAGMINLSLAGSFIDGVDGSSYYPAMYSIKFNSTAAPDFISFGSEFGNVGNARILFRAVPSSAAPYSIDFMSYGVRYRFIDDSAKDLYEDYLVCGYIDFEIGTIFYGDKAYYGFRFARKNCEITYFNDNSGTLKNETLFFKAENSHSTSGETTTLGSLFNGFEYRPIGFNNSSGLTAVVYASYAQDEDCTYVSAQNTSKWFKDQFISKI